MGRVEDEIKNLAAVAFSGPDVPYWVLDRLSKACFAAGNVGVGRVAYLASLRRDPWPLGTRARFIASLMEARQRPLVDECVTYAASCMIDSVATAYAKYEIFKSVGEWKHAESSLTEGLCISPDSLKLRVRRAALFARTGRVEHGRSEIERALLSSSGNNIALRELGVIALKLNLKDLTEQCFLRSVAIDPEEDPHMWRYLAQCARQRGQQEEASGYELLALKTSANGGTAAVASEGGTMHGKPLGRNL